MSEPDALAIVQELVAEIAPEVDVGRVDADLSEDLGLDSMDSLNLAVAVKEKTGIDIPERDFPALRSIRRLAEYLGRHGAG